MKRKLKKYLIYLQSNLNKLIHKEKRDHLKHNYLHQIFQMFIKHHWKLRNVHNLLNINQQIQVLLRLNRHQNYLIMVVPKCLGEYWQPNDI